MNLTKYVWNIYTEDSKLMREIEESLNKCKDKH